MKRQWSLGLMSMFVGRLVLYAGVVLVSNVFGRSAQAADETDAAILALRKQISLQQKLIEAQQRQLSTQKKTLDRLETKIDRGTRVAKPSSEVSGSESARTQAKTSSSAGYSEKSPNVKADPKGTVIFNNPDFSLTLGGNLKVVAYASPVRPYVAGAPFFLFPKDVTGKENVFRLSGQYSSFNAAITGPMVGDFQSGALLAAVLTGGNLVSDNYGVTPVNAFAYLRNKHWSFSAGLQEDVFSPRMPDMIDTISALAFSGNPGNSNRAQLRVEHYVDLEEAGKITFATALTEPISTTLSSDLMTRTESNGIPSTEGRVSWAFGPPDANTLLKRPNFEVGISGVYGQYRTFTGGLGSGAPLKYLKTPVWGVAFDLGLRIGDRFGLQGEIYTGQALGNYMGTIGQAANNISGQALRSRGGWIEATWFWAQQVRSSVGYGVDDISNQAGLQIGQISRNRTMFANIKWDVTQWWRLGLEGTYRWTDYVGPIPNNIAPNNSGPGVMASTEFRF